MNDEKTFYKWVGERLKTLREKAGLKQNAVAKKAGIKPSFLSDVENSGKKISAFQIKRILEVMGYSPEEIYLNSEKKKTSILRFPGAA